MEEHVRGRDEVPAAAFGDAETARRFQRRLHELRGYDERVKIPDAIKYDESGYPLPPGGPSLAGRLRRLITG